MRQPENREFGRFPGLANRPVIGPFPRNLNLYLQQHQRFPFQNPRICLTNRLPSNHAETDLHASHKPLQKYKSLRIKHLPVRFASWLSPRRHLRHCKTIYLIFKELPVRFVNFAPRAQGTVLD